MALYPDGENSTKIDIYFVQCGASCSTELRNAFSVCQEAKFSPQIIPEENINDIELSSRTVLVLENFSGEIFDHLSSSDCLVVGPACISSCVTKKISIPNNGSPVYNIALYGTVICSTKLDKKNKDGIQKLASYMGAVYSDDLTLAVTHLIAEKASLLSRKYIKAIENNIPVVSPEWIKKSWETSQMGTNALDAKKFKLSPFEGMYISCSNLSMSIKKKLQTLIEANGGIYQRTLELNKTAVLVINDPEGKKWQHAQQWGIPCVAPTWVYESVEKGHLAPSKNHLIEARPKCSTPTKSIENNSFMSCSDISCVQAASERSNIDETNTTFASDLSFPNIRSEGKNKKLQLDDSYKKLLEDVTITEMKSAGLFLDGCKVYLSGFTPLEFDKLKKIINYGGATLYTTITDGLSHVVVGEFSQADVKQLSSLMPRPHVVKLDWLIQSMRGKNMLNVEPYLCLQVTPAPPASPLSAKGLQLLKSDRHDSPNESKAQVSRKLFVKASVVKPTVSEMESNSIDVSALEKRALEEMNREKEDQLKKERELEQMCKEMETAQKQKELEAARQQKEREDLERQKFIEQQNLTKASSGKQVSTLNDFTSNDDDQSTMDPFFQDLWFKIYGYDEIQHIQESIELVGGKLVTGPSDPIPDFAIVPVEGIDTEIKAKNIVSIIFVEDCYDHGCLLNELEYYHQPLPGLTIVDKKLEGAVLGLSGFSRAERRLLDYVANKLGALVQDMFSRIDNPDKGVKKSTHLVCKEMSGKKYEAALKWGVPVVGPAWLLGMVDSPEKKSSLSSSSFIHSLQGSKSNVSVTEGPDSGAPNPSNRTLENADDDGINNITPVNQILRRVSIPGSAGPPPFHIQTPETPYGRVLTDNTPSPATRKRWKKWIDNFPDLYEGSPSGAVRERRPSTPLDVIKKQLWVKFGGFVFEGIEPETGRLLPQGPYAEWAGNDQSLDSFSAETEEIKQRLSGAGLGPSTDNAADIVEAIHRRISEVRASQDEASLVTTAKPRTSSKFELSLSQIKREEAKMISEEENHHVMWDFEAPKRSIPSSNLNTKEITKENVPANRLEATKRSYSAMKDSALDLNEKTDSHASPAPPSKKKLQDDMLSSTPLDVPSKKAQEAREVIGKTTCANPEPVPSKVPTIDEDRITITVNKDIKVFLLSGFSGPAKQKYEGIIRLLGGAVTQTASYDPSTTHIIVEKPIRSEKLLCCIASGKWVLHSSYVDSCYEKRAFLPEEEFEWGNPISSSRLPILKPGSTEAGLALAGHKWRRRKQDLGSASPFREMIVVLYTSENKLPQFKRLLEAGDATILEKSEILKANHIIWEEGKIQMPVSLAELAQRKIHIVPPVYLGEYLVKSPPPSEYYPSSYIKFIKSKKSMSKR